MQVFETKWKKNIVVFLSGQCITLFGSMLVHYAVQWHITLTTQSGVAMMLMSVSMAVPMFLISPFAGVWADRYSKKLLINTADAAIAGVTLLMAVVFSLGYEYIALLMVCVAVRGLGQGIQSPSVHSFIPEMVPEEHLIRVNGFNSAIQSAVMFLSPIAGGALIALVPIQTALYIDVVTAAIGISMLVFFVKTPPKEKKAEQTPAWHEMAEGVKYIMGNDFIKKVMVASIMFNLMIAPPAILSPLQTVRNFGEEPWRLVAIELAFFIGMSSGGALLGVWGGLKNKCHTVAAAALISGISSVGLGLAENFVLYLICMGVAGLVMPGINAPLMTVLQIRVEPEYMGRVFSVLTMLGSIVMPAGMLVWGPLADVVTIDWLMIASGIGVVASSAFLISSKTLREAGRV